MVLAANDFGAVKAYFSVIEMGFRGKTAKLCG